MEEALLEVDLLEVVGEWELVAVNPVVDEVADEVVEPTMDEVVEPVLDEAVEPTLGEVVEPTLEEVAEPLFDGVVELILDEVVEAVLEEAVESSIVEIVAFGTVIEKEVLSKRDGSGRGGNSEIQLMTDLLMSASSHQPVYEQAGADVFPVSVVETVPVAEQAVIVWHTVEHALVIVVVDELTTEVGHVTSQEDTVEAEHDELDELDELEEVVEEPVEDPVSEESSAGLVTVALSVR